MMDNLDGATFLRHVFFILPFCALVWACGAPPESTPRSDQAHPAFPAWATTLIGKPLDAAGQVSSACHGFVDIVNVRFTGAPEGVLVEGWGWDRAGAQAVAHVLLTDESRRIVGAGEGGRARPDVPKAMPEVTSTQSGWQGVADLVKGDLVAWGLVGDGKQVCRLGQIRL